MVKFNIFFFSFIPVSVIISSRVRIHQIGNLTDQYSIFIVVLDAAELEHATA